MKKKLFICFLLIGSLMGNVMAQDIITNPLLFVFKLHGQTRKYQFTFNQSNDTLYLHWGIERNTRWQSGSYAMPQEALKTAVRLSFLQPEDGQHICLPIQETFALLSATAFQELKSQKAFHYNQTEYQLADTKSQAMGYSLLHVNDSVDGCEMWIMDNPDFPLIWEIQNNPLGINWKVAPIDLPAHNLKEEIIQSSEKMGSIYYAYPTPNGIQTPVPEGYSPFYISHYGRHGSRWMTSDERYLEVIRVFDTFHNKSGLTDLGEDVRLRLQKVWENARGRGGNLTPLGEKAPEPRRRTRRAGTDRSGRCVPQSVLQRPSISRRLRTRTVQERPQTRRSHEAPAPLLGCRHRHNRVRAGIKPGESYHQHRRQQRLGRLIALIQVALPRQQADPRENRRDDIVQQPEGHGHHSQGDHRPHGLRRAQDGDHHLPLEEHRRCQYDLRGTRHGPAGVSERHRPEQNLPAQPRRLIHRRAQDAVERHQDRQGRGKRRNHRVPAERRDGRPVRHSQSGDPLP